MKLTSFLLRKVMNNALRKNENYFMSAWQVLNYGMDKSLLSFSHDVEIPTIEKPDDILIKIKAASLNALDLRMKEGYGSTIIDLARKLDQRSFSNVKDTLPLILGRDCSGIVVDKGRSVEKFQLGDEVWCSIGAEKQGCFAEYTIAPETLVSLKPKNLTFEQAASFPYVACTVWGALCTIARLHSNSDRRLSVLLHAGSGGIGTFAVQYSWSFFLSLAKVFNARVTATCSPDAFDLLKSLGADNLADYDDVGAFERLIDFGPYDIILKSVDTELARKSTNLLGLWRGSMNVDICNPLLRNTDQAGLIPGLAQSAVEFATQFLTHALDGRISLWGYVKPEGYILDNTRPLIEAGRIKPVIHEIVEFSRLNEAMENYQNGQMRGKIVVKI